jgi:hypothetical protein
MSLIQPPLKPSTHRSRWQAYGQTCSTDQLNKALLPSHHAPTAVLEGSHTSWSTMRSGMLCVRGCDTPMPPLCLSSHTVPFSLAKANARATEALATLDRKQTEQGLEAKATRHSQRHKGPAHHKPTQPRTPKRTDMCRRMQLVASICSELQEAEQSEGLLTSKGKCTINSAYTPETRSYQHPLLVIIGQHTSSTTAAKAPGTCNKQPMPQRSKQPIDHTPHAAFQLPSCMPPSCPLVSSRSVHVCTITPPAACQTDLCT